MPHSTMISQNYYLILQMNYYWTHLSRYRSTSV